MRIVKRAELLQQPCGTMFSKCKSLSFDDLCIFLGPFGNDFVYDSLLGIDFGNPANVDKATDALVDSSIEVDIDLYGSARWGNFDEEETFAIYSAEEQAAFIARIQYALYRRLITESPQFPEHLITVVSPHADVVEHSTNIIKGVFQDAIVLGSVRAKD